MNKNLLLIFALLICASLGANYNYTYHTNGADWFFGVCHTGQEQSPINIDTRHVKHIPNRAFCFIPSDKPQNTHVETHHQYLKSKGSWSYLRTGLLDEEFLQGTYTEFHSVQFHIHSPAEHTINNKQYDVELHVFHVLDPKYAPLNLKRTDAVITFFFEVDDSHPRASQFFDQWDTAYLETPLNFNFRDALEGIFNPDGNYFYYSGSRTSPGCAESVSFFIYERPLPITSDQLRLIQARFQGDPKFAGGKGNNRVLQPQNTRQVYVSSGNCLPLHQNIRQENY